MRWTFYAFTAFTVLVVTAVFYLTFSGALLPGSALADTLSLRDESAGGPGHAPRHGHRIK